MKGVQMSRARKLAVGMSLLVVLGVPGSAVAQGSDGCFGESVKQFHSSFMGAAQSGPGALRDFIEWIRENQSTFPWCQ
jgi:hypothetical protein